MRKVVNANIDGMYQLIFISNEMICTALFCCYLPITKTRQLNVENDVWWMAFCFPIGYCLQQYQINQQRVANLILHFFAFHSIIKSTRESFHQCCQSLRIIYFVAPRLLCHLYLEQLVQQQTHVLTPLSSNHHHFLRLL